MNAGELLVVVALPAGEVELSLAAVEDLAPGFDKEVQALVAALDRQPARLPGDVGRKREELLAFEGEAVALLACLGRAR
jgi:hypothetical protein